MLVSIDPGFRVGAATFNKEGKDQAKTTYELPAFYRFLESAYDYSKKFDEKIIFLYEDFTLRQDKAYAQTGSKMPASQSIGAIWEIHTMLGDNSKIECSLPSNIVTALKWAGYKDIVRKMEKNRNYHPADDVVAHAHGIMWLIQQGLRKHPIFES